MIVALPGLFSYLFLEVKVTQILIDSLIFQDYSDMTNFPANSFYSFYPIGLNLGGQLDHKVVQDFLFKDYTTSSFDRVIAIF